eukprot:Rhum_TRINITY_DN15011_c8_g1::Rhum_TRINITY_DN15011_c8_g1_i1::g.134045::m.134045
MNDTSVPDSNATDQFPEPVKPEPGNGGTGFIVFMAISGVVCLCFVVGMYCLCFSKKKKKARAARSGVSSSSGKVSLLGDDDDRRLTAKVDVSTPISDTGDSCIRGATPTPYVVTMLPSPSPCVGDGHIFRAQSVQLPSRRPSVASPVAAANRSSPAVLLRVDSPAGMTSGGRGSMIDAARLGQQQRARSATDLHQLSPSDASTDTAIKWTISDTSDPNATYTRGSVNTTGQGLSPRQWH